MQSVTSNGVAESLSYSETEVKTGGRWIDGKNIYRKVIKQTITASGATIILRNIKSVLGYETITNLYLINMGNDGNVSMAYYWGSNDKIRVYIGLSSANHLIVEIGESWPTRPLTCYIVLEYTKTTD